MTKYSDIVNYFRAFAEKYLAHTPTHKTFYMKGLDEFLNSLTVDGNYPCMLFHKYDFRIGDNSYDSLTKDRVVAFSVIGHVSDIDDYEAQTEVMDECEEIINYIVNDMRADARDQRNDVVPFTKMDSVQATVLENYADGNFGYYVTVDISSVHKTVNPVI